MARSRNIKPGLYVNEQLALCSFPARYIFPGLWMMADRDGYMEDRPMRVKASLLPFDNCDADSLLRELHDAGLIVRYEKNGCKCLWIPGFRKHQSPHTNEECNEVPRHDSDSTLRALAEHSESTPRVLAEASNQESGINEEGINEEGIRNQESEATRSLEKPKPSATHAPRFRPEDIHLPPELSAPPFPAAWSEWLSYRRDTRQSLREATLRKQLEFLAPHGPTVAADMVATSIRNGWKGLFSPQEKSHANGKQPRRAAAVFDGTPLGEL